MEREPCPIPEAYLTPEIILSYFVSRPVMCRERSQMDTPLKAEVVCLLILCPSSYPKGSTDKETELHLINAFCDRSYFKFPQGVAVVHYKF